MKVLRDRRWMLFVDGENFSKAGQRALAAVDIQPAAGERWRPDVYLWAGIGAPSWSNTIEPTTSTGQYGWQPAADLRRAYYYTSDDADEPEWTATRLAIREIGFEPQLFKRRKGRSKAVDVALASDVLTLGASGQYEVAIIVAGDGDYVPLLQAVKRLGLHVGVAFIVKDTSSELRIAADEFLDLTEPLARSWQEYHAQNSSEAAYQAKIAARDAEAATAEPGT